MSHDQKPARIRVVDGGGAAAGRRRGDAPTVIEHGEGVATSGTALVAGAAAPQTGARTSPLLLSALFILGCVAGAVGLTLSGVL